MQLTIPEGDKQEMMLSLQALVDQESRAVIDSDDAYARGADLKRLISNQLKKADERKKEYTKPLKEVIDRINADVKRMTGPAQLALTSISGKLNDWVRKQEAEKELARLEAARKAEEEAMARAEALERERIEAEAREKALRQAGEEEAAERAARDAEKAKQDAEEVIEEGTRVSDMVQVEHSTPVRGDWGAVASVRRDWKWRLTDFSALPDAYKQVDTGALNGVMRDTQRVAKQRAQQEGLRGKAQEAFVKRAMDDLTVPGVEFYQDVSSAVR